MQQQAPNIDDHNYKSISVTIPGESAAEETFLDFFKTSYSEAFTSLFNNLYPFASRYARKFVSREDAEDIVSSVFINLWEKKKQFKNPVHVKAFLRISVKHACFNHFLDKSRRLKRENGWQYLEYQEETGKDYDSEEIAAEKLVRIYAVINKLPPRCRRIFQMAYFENLKNREIAHLLGISAFTVKNQKYYALKVLKMIVLSVLAGCVTFGISN